MTMNRRLRLAATRCLSLLALIAAPAAFAQDGDSAIQEAAINLSGAKTHFLIAGGGNPITVLLLHGGRFNAETWRELGTIELLADKGYRVVALDLPGFGESDPGNTPREHYLRDLMPLLTGTPPVIVSPSMSGSFSLPYVAEWGGHMAGFVPIAPVGLDEYRDGLAGVELPTLAIWGENDTVIPVEQANILIDTMVPVQLVVLEGAGHACYLDRPDEFHRVLLEFLDSLGP